MDDSLDVLLVIRSCIEHYPPTVNQANLLAEAGLRVGLVDLRVGSKDSALHPSIRRWQVHRMWNSKEEPPLPARIRWWNWLLFFRACHSAIRQNRPRVVIAYDTLGSIFVKPATAHYRTVYHFHELTGPERGESFGPRRARRKAAERSRSADLVVFSDPQRARIFQERAGLSALPKVVMNCPRRMETVPGSPLRARLAEWGYAQPRIVGYLGSIGADQGLVEAARSMRFWPVDSVLALIGPASDSMRKSILEAAADADAHDRVIFLGAHRHEQALALVAGADAGISLIQPNNENWLYSAGAINKRFEYMALGLPQVTNAGPGVREIIEKDGCGFCVNPRSIDSIGARVRDLLECTEQRFSFSRKARDSHLKTYNYEAQFAGVLRWILTACRSG